jgi:two-component system alkaline phosphatase synthesis response regulator PhoP
VKLKVVVIDDDAYDRHVIRKSLTMEGYDVIEAENGLAGLDAIRKESPDLIICDVRMPEMDGDELLETLRNSKNGMGIIPFIFISGFTNGEQKINRLKKGADNFLEKPVDLELLSACVKSNLIGMERVSNYMKHQLDSIAKAMSEILEQDILNEPSQDVVLKNIQNASVDSYVEMIISALQKLQLKSDHFPDAKNGYVSRLDYMNFFLAEYQKRKSLADTANGEDLSWLLIFQVAKAQAQGTKLPMSDLYLSAPSAKSTINARINNLIGRSIFNKAHDETDGRRQLISLSDKFHSDLLKHIDASVKLIQERVL